MTKEKAYSLWKEKITAAITDISQDIFEEEMWLSLDCYWPDGIEDRMADAVVNILRTSVEAQEFVKEE